MLVAAAMGCYLVWFLLPYWAGHLTESQQRLADYSGYATMLPVEHPVYYGLWFALWLIAALGLMFLKNWARHLFLGLSLLGVALAPFSGFVVQPPLDGLFANASALLDGAILAIAYLSPFAARFKETRSRKMPMRPEMDAHEENI
jgi:hypothetical protein